MNKPANEPIAISRIVMDGTLQLRYVSKRRFRKLRARARRQGIALHWRACDFGPFYSWLRPL